MRRLLLMRHGKSDWNAAYGRDHERPLNPRGVRSARLMGRLLSAKGFRPDLVLTSTAVRALTTARLAAEAGDWRVPIRETRDLYEGGPEAVLDAAAGAPDVGTLLLVGHQPTWSLLASRLVGRPVEMKTATVAVIHLPIDTWAGVRDATGELAELLHPRDHFGSAWDERVQ